MMGVAPDLLTLATAMPDLVLRRSLPVAPEALPARRHLPLAPESRDADQVRPIYAVWEITLRCRYGAK
jgi:hypothetical protein